MDVCFKTRAKTKRRLTSHEDKGSYQDILIATGSPKQYGNRKQGSILKLKTAELTNELLIPVAVPVLETVLKC